MEKKYFVHESSYVDDNVELGDGTKVWHFSHVQGGSVMGKHFGDFLDEAQDIIEEKFNKMDQDRRDTLAIRIATCLYLGDKLDKITETVGEIVAAVI